MADLTIYTDGACSGNPGFGGWGAVIHTGTGYPTEIGGASRNETTNNEMELMAAVEALDWIRRCGENHIGSKAPVADAKTDSLPEADLILDSQYVVRGVNEWLKGWKSRGWRKTGNGEISNIGLWKRLDETLEELRETGWVISFTWVKGHAGDHGNNHADALACRFRDQAIKQYNLPGEEQLDAAVPHPTDAVPPVAPPSMDPTALVERAIDLMAEDMLRRYRTQVLARPNPDQAVLVENLFGMGEGTVSDLVEIAFRKKLQGS